MSEDKLDVVTLKGLARTEGGKVSQSHYFDFLRLNLDDYSDVQYTPDEANRISTHLRKLSTGSSAMVPMYCSGPMCPFASTCEFQKMNKAPIGKQCIIEVTLMKEWIIGYIEEYGIDPSNLTELGYANELAEIEIYMRRLKMGLAKPDNLEIVVEQTVGIGNDGTPITQKAISPFMEEIEILQNRRSRVIKLMVGDRQEQYKKEAALKVKLTKDPSSKMAEIRSKLENLTRQMDELSKAPSELTGKKKEVNDALVVTPQDLIDAL